MPTGFNTNLALNVFAFLSRTFFLKMLLQAAIQGERK